MASGLITCLIACQRANDMSGPYRPSPSLAGQTARLVQSGHVVRSPVGSGFWITAEGRRLVAIERNARMLKLSRSGVKKPVSAV